MSAKTRASSSAQSSTSDELTEADWGVIYADQLPRVYNFFRFRLGDDLLAEELTARTFEKAWRGRKHYRRDRGAFSTWLFTVARNVAIDFYRERHHEQVLSLEGLNPQDAGYTSEIVIQRRIDLARLHTLLGALPPRERELIELKYGAELTNRAVAQLTGLTESNVGTLLHRAVQHLRNAWEERPA